MLLFATTGTAANCFNFHSAHCQNIATGAAVGKACNCVDWIAKGLAINGIKDFG